MAPVHLEAVAADDDAGALTDVRVNVEGRSEVYTKDSVPDGGGGGDGASFGDGTLTVTWRLLGAGDAAGQVHGGQDRLLGWLALGVSADGTMDSSGAAPTWSSWSSESSSSASGSCSRSTPSPPTPAGRWRGEEPAARREYLHKGAGGPP